MSCEFCHGNLHVCVCEKQYLHFGTSNIRWCPSAMSNVVHTMADLTGPNSTTGMTQTLPTLLAEWCREKPSSQAAPQPQMSPGHSELDTSRDPWKQMETTEDQQTPFKTRGDPWRPGSNNGDQAETHGDQGRPADTPGDQARPSERPLETRQDNGTPAETLRRLRETTEDQRRPWQQREIPGDQAGTMETKQRPMETKEDQQTPLETK